MVVRGVWVFGILLVAALASCKSPPAAAKYDTTSIPTTSTVSFVICGDTRSVLKPWKSSTQPAKKRIMKRLLKLNPQFIMNTGDLVTIGDSATAWASFDKLSAKLRKANIRIVPALGNHEYTGDNQSALKHYFKRFPDIKKQKWYAYDAGALRILMLDSNFDELTSKERRLQKEWLNKALKAAEADKKVKFVLLGCHHPPFTNGSHDPEKKVLEDFIKPARNFVKPRALISGHVHSYERFKVDGFDYIVSGGCGAPPADIETDPEDWRTEPVYKGPEERGHHLMDCEVGQESLACSVEALDGRKWRTIDNVRWKVRTSTST